MFIALSLDLKSPGWAMATVYLTSQPLSGVLRAKAIYRTIRTFIGGAVTVAILPNLGHAPELTTLALIFCVALCVFISLLDRTPRSYMFVLSGCTAALVGFSAASRAGTVFDTAVWRVEEITLGVVCTAIVYSLIFPKSAFSAFRERLRSAIANARRWLADGLIKQATPRPKWNGAGPPLIFRALFARHKLALRHLAASSGHRPHSRVRSQDRGAPATAERCRGSADRAAAVLGRWTQSCRRRWPAFTIGWG